jgi:hypothetical protein
MILRHFRLNFPSQEARFNMCSFWGRCRTALLIASLGLSTGCATDAVPKKTVDDDALDKQARQFREDSTDLRGTGLSQKSQEIERHLGYQ